jgi:CHAD domain-containing protein
LARRTLKLRLHNVATALRDACKHDFGIEHVHRLRVATRRAVAASDVFRDWLPKRRRRRIRKQLNRARRAAGEVRDLDVFQQQLAPWLAPDSTFARQMSKRIERARAQAVPQIERAFRKFENNNYLGQVAKLLKRVRWRGGDSATAEPTVRDEARRCLRPCIDDFLRASEADLTDIEKLHQFRIAGKHLRYSLEIFGNVLEAEHRDPLLAKFVDLQDGLGAINDLAAAIERLKEWSDATARSSALLELRSHVEQRFKERRAEFLDRYDRQRVHDFVHQLELSLAGHCTAGAEKPASSNGQVPHGQANGVLAPRDDAWLPDFTD